MPQRHRGDWGHREGWVGGVYGRTDMIGQDLGGGSWEIRIDDSLRGWRGDKERYREYWKTIRSVMEFKVGGGNWQRFEGMWRFLSPVL